MPDWKSKESHTRLLAAIVAATPDMKLDYRKIASMYGEGATYDSIEGRFRVIKKEAAILKTEIETGQRPEAPMRGNFAISKKPRTPKKPASQEGVLNGRVTKSANSSPTKRRSPAQLKKELMESSSSSSSVEGPFVSEQGSVQDSFDYDAATTTSFADLDGAADQLIISQYTDSYMLPSYDWNEQVV